MAADAQYTIDLASAALDVAEDKEEYGESQSDIDDESEDDDIDLSSAALDNGDCDV